jgi:hypothetical protein
MPGFKYSNAKVKTLLQEVYGADVTPSDLPASLYTPIAEFLRSGLYNGFGASLSNIEFGTPDHVLLSSLRENIYMFSAAKTFQQTLEMSEALIDADGNIRSFNEFEKVAREIFHKYNGEIGSSINRGWLGAEYDTAIGQAQMAKKWNRIVADKEILPYLRYNAVEDERLCPVCGPLNEITLPVDHPFWKQYPPLNHYRCRCIIEQYQKEEGAKLHSSDEQIEEAKAKSKVSDEFLMNAGMLGEVFQTSGAGKHPYFTVPRSFANLARRNFGLTIPDNDDPQ